MITYTWTINTLTYYPLADKEKDVVYQVYWVFSGTDENGCSSQQGSVTSITYDPNEPFIPYADLTKDAVVSWVQEAIGPDQIALMEKQIAEEIAKAYLPPASVTAPPPWVSPTEEAPLPDAGG